MKLLFFVHNSGFWCCSWIENQHQNVAHQNGRKSKSNIRWSRVLILLSDYVSLKIKYLIYARAMEPRGCNHRPAYGNRWGVFTLALCSVGWRTVVLKRPFGWILLTDIPENFFFRSSSVLFWLLRPSLILFKWLQLKPSGLEILISTCFPFTPEGVMWTHLLCNMQFIIKNDLI